MATGLDFQRVTVRIFNHFEGPNFVNGLAKQTSSYEILSDDRARLEFAGGFDSSVTYVQIVEGEGFGIDANGRFTGTIDSYFAFEKDTPENGWRFDNLDTTLDHLNTLASDSAVTFEDLLLIPLEYDFVGAEFDDVFICGSFDDIARGRAGDDNFDGLDGADSLFGHVGADVLTGGGGDDLLAGGRDADLVIGGSGADEIRGGDGRDVLRGGTGADRIEGGRGGDAMHGGHGSDALLGGAGSDRVHGGNGSDSVSGQEGDDVLLGQRGGDTLLGGEGDDRLAGGAGTNVLFGQRDSDRLTGGSGSDQLFGGSGADRLSSGTGADFLIGGTGDDTLAANAPGSGAGDKAVDTFIFEAAFGDDLVADFEVGFDGIVLAAGITEADVTTSVAGEDVLVSVDFLGTQTILVQGVASLFNPDIDLLFA
jgi:Ca2+-binding RTX toxin-like protein